eukprot:scaffold1204_cov313-Pavlova_lutheri.AAC.9
MKTITCSAKPCDSPCNPASKDPSPKISWNRREGRTNLEWNEYWYDQRERDKETGECRTWKRCRAAAVASSCGRDSPAKSHAHGWNAGPSIGMT